MESKEIFLVQVESQMPTPINPSERVKFDALLLEIINSIDGFRSDFGTDGDHACTNLKKLVAKVDRLIDKLEVMTDENLIAYVNGAIQMATNVDVDAPFDHYRVMHSDGMPKARGEQTESDIGKEKK